MNCAQECGGALQWGSTDPEPLEGFLQAVGFGVVRLAVELYSGGRDRGGAFGFSDLGVSDGRQVYLAQGKAFRPLGRILSSPRHGDSDKDISYSRRL